ncbi:MAG: orotate phosphoribosyltransferase [Pseudomonadota bacterium]
MNLRQEFIAFTLAQGALRFGEFETKAGRLSPYFFNAGLFNDGDSLNRLAQFYAKTVIASGIVIDGLFGPAYKGIPLVSACAIALAQAGHNLPYTFNRKEAKDHGEGGSLVGAPLAGRVLIVDDVVSAGTSVRESVELIRQAGATPCGVVIALDRMERGKTALSAVQEIEQSYQIPVIAVADLDDLMYFLSEQADFERYAAAVKRYRLSYGIAKNADQNN